MSCEDFNDFNRSLSPESQLNKGEGGKGPRSIIEIKQLYIFNTRACVLFEHSKLCDTILHTV